MGSERISSVCIFVMAVLLACGEGARTRGCLSWTQWQCKSRKCIEAVRHCDGRVDCPDGSDETKKDCSTFNCTTGQFRCAYGACIAENKLCDGSQDCRDNSDEWQDTCRTKLRRVNEPVSCTITKSLANGFITNQNDPFKPLNGRDSVPAGDVIKYECIGDYRLVDRYGFIMGKSSLIVCVDGDWSIKAPECKLTCSPDTIRGVTIKPVDCVLNGNTLNCGEPLPAGTVASIKCADYYASPISQLINTQTLVCDDNGRWSPEPTACMQRCGEASPNDIPFVIGGNEISVNKVPWHVGIYHQRRPRAEFTISCGGSILNARLVISAMHCFWNHNQHKPNSAQSYRIAAGKSYSSLDHVELSQTFEIKEIHYQDSYEGYGNNYKADIALVTLETSIVFRAGISPICVPLGLKLEEKSLSTGTVGIVAGFGRTSSSGSVSDRLKTIELPVVERNYCKDQTGLTLTSDKYCAGFLNKGISVCDGDSGGGWAEVHTENNKQIYSLRGIVSTGVSKNFSCDSDKFSTFTNILHYDTFITEHLAKTRPLI